MIEKNRHGLYDATCDRCPAKVQNLDAESFRQAVSLLMRRDWSMHQGKHGWEHFCPQCTQNRNTIPVEHGGY